jgi:hypothetical protein
VVVNDDFISIVFDGTCHPADQEDDFSVRKYTKMPNYDPDGKEL